MGMVNVGMGMRMRMGMGMGMPPEDLVAGVLGLFRLKVLATERRPAAISDDDEVKGFAVDGGLLRIAERLDSAAELDAAIRQPRVEERPHVAVVEGALVVKALTTVRRWYSCHRSAIGPRHLLATDPLPQLHIHKPKASTAPLHRLCLPLEHSHAGS